MLKKRIIFTLLHDAGQFMLSRNFRLQRVGDVKWLQRNYNFAQIAFYIDELIVLDVTRGERDPDAFSSVLKEVSAGCFAPIAAGGGVTSIDHASRLLRSGADKIVVNTILFEDPDLVRGLAAEFGQQCVVGSVDLKKRPDDTFGIVIRNGSTILDKDPTEALAWLNDDVVGELYLNCVDRDGTGQGYDLSTLSVLPADCSVPIILAGGVGNSTHFSAGLDHPAVDAVATAHLFNFIGDGLKKARHALTDGGAELAVWGDPSQVNLSIGSAPGAA